MNDLLTVREVAQMLRVSKVTVFRWVTRGILEAVTLPHVGERKQLRIKRTSIDAVLQGTMTQR
jgi:excisionase family DNA binding protein